MDVDALRVLPWHQLVPRRTDPQLYARLLAATRRINEACDFAFGPDSNDLADWLGESRTTVHRYMKSRQASGWVEWYDGRSKWRVTPEGQLREAEMLLAATRKDD